MSFSIESTKQWARTPKQRSVMKIWPELEPLSSKVRDPYKQWDYSRRKERREKLTSVSHHKRKTLSPRRSNLTMKRSNSSNASVKFWPQSLPTRIKSSKISKKGKKRMNDSRHLTRQLLSTSKQSSNFDKASTRKKISWRIDKKSW